MKKLLAMGFVLAVLGLSQAVRADDSTPDGVIRSTVDEVLTIVAGDKAIAANQKRLQELVEAKILPHFDFTRMTQLTVGKAWRTMPDTQKQALTTEFRTMLVRTYAKVFSTYPDPTIEVKPIKPSGDPNEETVRTVIRVKDGKTALVDYEMKKSADGWKVFDITVEGVSLVTSYRGSFADQIQQNGVDGLIKALADKNQGVISKANASKQVRAN